MVISRDRDDYEIDANLQYSLADLWNGFGR